MSHLSLRVKKSSLVPRNKPETIKDSTLIYTYIYIIYITGKITQILHMCSFYLHIPTHTKPSPYITIPRQAPWVSQQHAAAHSCWIVRSPFIWRCGFPKAKVQQEGSTGIMLGELGLATNHRWNLQLHSCLVLSTHRVKLTYAKNMLFHPWSCVSFFHPFWSVRDVTGAFQHVLVGSNNAVMHVFACSRLHSFWFLLLGVRLSHD